MSAFRMMVIVVVLLTAGLAVGLLYPRLAAQLAGDWAPEMMLEESRDCNPVGVACRVQGENLGVSLTLEADVRPLAPFTVTVELTGAARGAEAVAVRFDMPDMDMGLNRFRLERREAGRWQGEAIIPVCSTGRADWRATVEVAGEPDLAAAFTVLLQ